MMKHKHYDVLIAIANGQEVEFRVNSDSNWRSFVIDVNSADPFTFPDYEWRVKKEPVITVKYFQLRPDFPYNPSWCYHEFEPDLEEWHLKITFQDNIAIKAELPTRK